MLRERTELVGGCNWNSAGARMAPCAAQRCKWDLHRVGPARAYALGYMCTPIAENNKAAASTDSRGASILPKYEHMVLVREESAGAHMIALETYSGAGRVLVGRFCRGARIWLRR